MQLWVTYTENPETTDPGEDSDDEWRWQGVTNMHGRFDRIHEAQPKSYLHQGPFKVEAQPGDTVQVVWCTYANGSTFGCTDGQFDCLGIVKTKGEIAALKEKAKSIHDDYFGWLEAVYVDPVVV